MTMFGTLHPDGTLTNVRNLPQSAMLACPHFIMVAEHYRANNSCRCNDPKHTEMGEWDMCGMRKLTCGLPGRMSK